MTKTIIACSRGLLLVAAFLAFAGLASANAAGLKAGEYTCVGSGGSILIGLGFKLRADDSYTDLDGKSVGRVTFSGSNVNFIGGHLAGETGRNVRGGCNFEIHSASCSCSR